MSVLHDYPVLGATEIKDANGGDNDLKKTSLHEQVERVRITLQPLTFEEMSKLGRNFKTHYRTSASYQVSVVLGRARAPPRRHCPCSDVENWIAVRRTVAGLYPSSRRSACL